MYELLLRVIYANVGLYCAIAILLIVTGCGAARGGAVVTFPSATPPHSLTLPPVPCRIAKVPFPWQAYGLLVTLFDDMASGAAPGLPVTHPHLCPLAASFRAAAQYLFVFAAVAWIWAPGQQSFQYSLYSQVGGQGGERAREMDAARAVPLPPPTPTSPTPPLPGPR